MRFSLASLCTVWSVWSEVQAFSPWVTNNQHSVSSFSLSSIKTITTRRVSLERQQTSLNARKVKTLTNFDPLKLGSEDLRQRLYPDDENDFQYFRRLRYEQESNEDDDDNNNNHDDCVSSSNLSSSTSSAQAASAALTALVTLNALTAERALAAGPSSLYSQGTMDPQNFQPVCPASDGFYRLLQASTEAVVGQQSFTEYGPLIAGGLLRVRLELCVVESFVNEAVIPFVKQNGLSWILPLHETVETFIAGVIFALASTFILIGSTKILTVIITYTDFLLGLPARVLGGFVYDRSMGKPVTLDVGLGPFKTRLIGPPKTMGPVKETSLTDLGPIGLVTALLSGIIKVLGAVVGVSTLLWFLVFCNYVVHLLQKNLLLLTNGFFFCKVCTRCIGCSRYFCRQVPGILGIALHLNQVSSLQNLS